VDGTLSQDQAFIPLDTQCVAFSGFDYIRSITLVLSDNENSPPASVVFVIAEYFPESSGKFVGSKVWTHTEPARSYGDTPRPFTLKVEQSFNTSEVYLLKVLQPEALTMYGIEYQYEDRGAISAVSNNDVAIAIECGVVSPTARVTTPPINTTVAATTPTSSPTAATSAEGSKCTTNCKPVGPTGATWKNGATNLLQELLLVSKALLNEIK